MQQLQPVTEDPAGPTDRPVAPRRPADRDATSRRRRYTDSAARWIVTAGGLTIIVSILGILLFIVIEVVPMFSGAEVSEGGAVSLSGPLPGAIVSDEHRSHAAILSDDGLIRVVRLNDGVTVETRDLLAEPQDETNAAEVEPGARPAVTAIQGYGGHQVLSAAVDNGSVLAAKLEWAVSFDGSSRVVTPWIGDAIRFDLDPTGTALGAFSVRTSEEGSSIAVAQSADGRLRLLRRDVEENLFTGETSESWQRGNTACAYELKALIVDRELRQVYGGAATGELIWWEIQGASLSAPRIVAGGEPAVTALNLLIGDDALVVGRVDGSLSIWFPTRRQGLTPELLPIRSFPPMDGAVRLLSPSARDKGFAAQDATGSLGLYYSTSHRVLFRGASPDPEAQALFIAPKADALFVVGREQIHQLLVDNPHPEPSWTSMFTPTHYEGYPGPAFVWQSTGGTDEFEAKLSLVPLMIGTLKGTVYSLILAIPLGVLGAMYTSHFMHHSVRRFVKPTVEIMAALPSVVLGFMAGLWLAPRVEQGFTALLLMFVVLPVMVVAAGLGWGGLPQRIRSHFAAGFESLIYAVVLVLGFVICIRLGPGVEAWLFGGNFKAWLLSATGLQYDQRNAVVVGLAMGFAVIPIIFSIAEDAFSNVPNNLVSGSLALGATRWQTVTRVVLPTASAGIFSAIMIGFGRAVGETMIVLMATGNTPIMDWNPFNGFRTLSANIAVEIPEAPHGATLYRTLFLAALILFIFTFVTNTIAELVRQRLRKRYAQL